MELPFDIELNWKDYIYLSSFLITLITFYRTFFWKRGHGSLNYKTEYGDEANLYLYASKEGIYDIKISGNEKLGYAIKYSGINISELKSDRKKYKGDKSLFFSSLKENEVIEIIDAYLLGKIKLEYQDKFSNEYYQYIEFDKKEDIESKSRRYYKLTKRMKKKLSS